MIRTKICAAVFVVFFFGSFPVALKAQTRCSRHHHYKLFDVGTLGGPTSFSFGLTRPLNNLGVSGGYADTKVLDLNFPNVNPYFEAPFLPADPFIQRAYRWQNGAKTKLPVLPGGTSAGAQWINDRGEIAGNSTNGEIDPLTGLPEIDAVVWGQDGKITNLGTFGGNGSIAWGINNRGQVAGGALNSVPDDFTGDFFFTGATQVHAFRWSNGALHDLGTLGGTDSMGLSINELGQVAGISATGNFDAGTGEPVVEPFFWDGKQMIDIGQFGGNFGYPNALNNSGEVVGLSSLVDGSGHAFAWSKKQGLRDLGTLGGSGSEALSINDDGYIVGDAFIVGDEASHAALWKDGRILDLGTVAGDHCSRPFWVNSQLQVVGFSDQVCQSFPHTHAFLWENGKVFDLNKLIADSSPSLHLTEGVEINEQGEIVGNGITASGDFHTFILIPCDESHPGIRGCDYSHVEDSIALEASPGWHGSANRVLSFGRNLRKHLQRDE